VPGRRLRLAEREDIAYLRGHHLGVRQIAACIGRDPATVSRELRCNLSPSPRRYRALSAHILARERARRPGQRKLVAGSPLRAEVAAGLRAGWSPGQIAGRLKRDHPGRAELQVSHETIYQALFVQGKGSLRAEVAAAVGMGHGGLAVDELGGLGGPARRTSPADQPRGARHEERWLPGE
jgi:transposase, IS30 family